MSMMDIAKLVETISTPADSFTLDEKAFTDNFGLHKQRYTWRWGKVTDPNRITIIILTVHEPEPEDDGSLTVFYNPATCLVMVGGELLRDRYVGHGLYSFNYDEEKPELARDLSWVLHPLSNPVRPAPCYANC